ncbi:MAG: 3-oxoacid CoA-transferase subunit B [Dehalococcoidia bacterium]|nr:3-oxoacid CoA-transferase subunit B [Dehalococcoidia bacterium]
MMKERLDRQTIAMRVAKEIPVGAVVNLGIGIPDLVANLIPGDKQVHFQAEHGVLGFGSIIFDQERIDWDYTDAGGHPVEIRPGGCFFHHADSFAMIRGGHIDITVLGALQVSEQGDIANWWFPDRGFGNIGGAMDLAVGSKRLFVAMEHTTKALEPKIVRNCTYPLTAAGVVRMVFTDLAVIEIDEKGLVLNEYAPGWTVEEIQALTEPPLRTAVDLKEIEL